MLFPKYFKVKGFKIVKYCSFQDIEILQDGLLVEFLEILSESDVPIFSNMTADNLPDDNMVKMLRLFKIILVG